MLLLRLLIRSINLMMHIEGREYTNKHAHSGSDCEHSFDDQLRESRKRFSPKVTHSASTMKKSSHANPDLVSRRDQKRNATVTMANKVKTTARAYILPGDSSVAKKVDNIFVCELDGHCEMGIRECMIFSSKNTIGDQAPVIQ